MSNPLITIFEANGAGMRPFLEEDDDTGATLEICRIQPAWFYVRKPRGDESVIRVRVMRQLTIDTVSLPDELQKCGYLSGFIAHLFDKYALNAVQLRGVVNESFRDYLLANPRWVCQDRAEEFEEGSNPSFVMFKA